MQIAKAQPHMRVLNYYKSCIYYMKELVDKPLIIHSHCNIKKVFFLDQRVVYLIKFNNDRNIYDTSPDVSLF